MLKTQEEFSERDFVFHPLPRSFFEPSAEIVAPRLLGHWLIRRTESGICSGLIVETEAYLTNDPACHSFKGISQRNRAMWGPPGHAYVYFIYGNHYCVNAVCQPAGIGEAVLIRAIEPAVGQDLMLKHRPVAHVRQLTSGPAKLCEALRIDRALDAIDLCDANSPLLIAANDWIEDYLERTGPVEIATRIGITKAAHLPLRFFVSGSEFVSRR